MKVLLLGDHTSSHIIKWAHSLNIQGIEIAVFSLSKRDKDEAILYESIDLYTMEINEDIFQKESSSKWRYLLQITRLRKIIRLIKPDIVHAHYASSYGLLGVLSGFHPLIVSVWGSDVYDFPSKSILHKALIKFNLSKADKVLSTSEVMAAKTEELIKKKIEVTPFGVDMNIFKPIEGTGERNAVTIGTVKAMEKKYGIAYLIEAFALVKKRLSDHKLNLLLVGSGSYLEEYKNLVRTLGIDGITEFTGKISFEKVPEYHNKIDIYVAVSILHSESFGVAIVEASSCGKPVIVSNVGGLPEVVENGVTGLVVPKQDVIATANAIEKLVLDKELRKLLGTNGRQRVQRKYNWDSNLASMIRIYEETLNEFSD